MSEHRTIWLEPACASKSGEDRHWCQDDAWGACEECGTKSVKYILATEHEALVKALTEIDTLATCCGVVDPAQHARMLGKIYLLARRVLKASVGQTTEGKS